MWDLSPEPNRVRWTRGEDPTEVSTWQLPDDRVGIQHRLERPDAPTRPVHLYKRHPRGSRQQRRAPVTAGTLWRVTIYGTLLGWPTFMLGLLLGNWLALQIFPQ